MPQITKISPQKRKKRVQVLKEGEFQKIYDKVLRFLSFRPRSEKEIKDYLAKKGVGGQIKKMVIKKLKRVKLLDDKKFAWWWIEQREGFRPSGRRLLEQELRKKGVGRETVEEILTNFFQKEKEKETWDTIAPRFYSSFEYKLALKAAKKKLSRYQKLPPFKFRQKMGAFLSRRGFSWEVIKGVVDEILKKR